MSVIEKTIQLVEDGHIDEALSILEDHLKTCSDEDIALIAQLYMEWGFYEKAAPLFEQLLETYVDNDELRVMLASIYIELEKDEQAFELLDMISEDDPAYLQALLQQADLYESQGLFEVAEQKLLEAKELAPNEIIIDFALGELLFSIGQYQRSLSFYEIVLEQEREINGIDVRHRLAEAYAFLGHYEKALDLYEQLQSEDPDILFKHGYIARQLKRNNIAIKVWKKLQEVDPEYYSVYFELGSLLKEEGMLKEAYELVKKGIEQNEFNKELYFLAAQLSLNLAEFNESMIYAKKAVELDNDYKDAILLLVDLYKQQDQHDDIINLIKSIKEAGSEDPLYNWQLAR